MGGDGVLAVAGLSDWAKWREAAADAKHVLIAMQAAGPIVRVLGKGKGRGGVEWKQRRRIRSVASDSRHSTPVCRAITLSRHSLRSDTPEADLEYKQVLSRDPVGLALTGYNTQQPPKTPRKRGGNSV
ncbi:hypothetical protein NEOLEDRAFT_1183503 [Neolentinus lepideus HHB14362 ss-1]|uniref:Uncharacterized protein n=1 Tax=Neolentinus lepideus HHB14362 ss-1 TaxID=1314782 RepID=A0A165N9B6_9AGAM|nr:hypothetical protein NEOLEDRAFT_1183503 [Neolentinus lepideus HHB14362 ss-1]